MLKPMLQTIQVTLFILLIAQSHAFFSLDLRQHLLQGHVIFTTATTASATTTTYTSSPRSKLIMLGATSNGSGNLIPTNAALPRDVKEAVSKCRAAVQEALQARLSRMDIEMPVGTKFGVEKAKTTKGQSRLGSGTIDGIEDINDGAPTLNQLQASDRELARLFVEMFQPLGGDHITVVFTCKDLAEAAELKWRGDPSASSRIQSLDVRRGSKKASVKAKKKPMGFASKLAAEINDSNANDGNSGTFQLPEGTEVALFVAPGAKELIVIDRICREVGMGTLVVLLNARLSSIESFGTETTRTLFLEDFEPVFHLRAAPQQEAPGCLLHRSYPGDWLLARKPKVGQPKIILAQTECPSNDECFDAYRNAKVGDLERGVETLLDGMAGWFR